MDKIYIWHYLIKNEHQSICPCLSVTLRVYLCLSLYFLWLSFSLFTFSLSPSSFSFYPCVFLSALSPFVPSLSFFSTLSSPFSPSSLSHVCLSASVSVSVSECVCLCLSKWLPKCGELLRPRTSLFFLCCWVVLLKILFPPYNPTWLSML